MDEIFLRNTMYWGDEFQKYLKGLHIAVFGLGGVGGYALDALVRAGAGTFSIVDFDTVSKSNINRQIIALNSTVGHKKTEVFRKRMKDINPDVEIFVYEDFYDGSQNEQIFGSGVDFVVDAIDSLRSKIGLLKYCKDNNIKVITSLGAGNRLDASRLRVSDLSEIKTKCPFVKNVISRLKKEGIDSGMMVVWSDESPKSLKKIKTIEKITKKDETQIEIAKFTPASTPVVPAVSGLLCANYIINFSYENYTKNNA